MITYFFKTIFISIFVYLWYSALFKQENCLKYNIPSFWKSMESENQSDRFCQIRMDDLGSPVINLDEKINISQLELTHDDVQQGGHWSPENCLPHQKVAIIIPFKERQHQLEILLNRLHPMLKKQKAHYSIFVINQLGELDFNRGLILNIGVVEALKLADTDCFIFHDVDLIPEHDWNIYFCDEGIRQISSAIDDARYHVKFWHNAGGVVSISKVNYFRINGHPNVYWGWGSEDNDFSARSMFSNLKLSRPFENVGRFKMFKHQRGFRKMESFRLFMSFRGRWKLDGLNSLLQLNSQKALEQFEHGEKSAIGKDNGYSHFISAYHLISVDRRKLYTNISVRVKKSMCHANNINLFFTWESLIWFLTFYGWM